MLVVALPHYEFIRISGADTVTFLQGQLSCDVTALSAERSLTGALCNLKGRVIADFRLLRQEGDDCLLQTQAGMASIILQVLNKYAVFSKVDLQRETAITATGLLGNEATTLLDELLGKAPAETNDVVAANGLCAVAVAGTEPRYEIWITDSATSAVDQLMQGPQGQVDDWLRQDFRAGILHVTPELSEQYTPQHLNYDISGVINFKKGCYTGQEIVARMYYRGKSNKRMHLFASDAAIAAEESAEKNETGGPVTVLAQAAPTARDPDNYLVLGIADLDPKADNSVLTGANGEALQRLILPYAA